MAAILGPIIKVASVLFGSSKQRYAKKIQNHSSKKRAPKLVRLPNERTFYAKYKRTRCASLPANVRLERVYRQ